MKLSPKGLALLQQCERCILHAYLDEGGRPTIGYGHLIQPGEHFPKCITAADAVNLLRRDLVLREDAVTTPTSGINQAQFDALVIFTFNVGVDRFEKSTLLKYVRTGNYNAASAEFLRWIYVKGNKSDGLIHRRSVEQQLFARGIYSYKILGKR